MKLVTIIIPVYNGEKYLHECLDSVVNQTYSNIEVVIINDGSTDHSKETLNYYQKRYKHINVIHNPLNAGLSMARNIGIEYANGEYLYFLDCDDYIREDAIEKMVGLAESYAASFVLANYQSGFIPYPCKKINDVKITHEDLEKNPEALKKYLCTAWNKLYLHSSIGDLRFPNGLYFEDNAFFYSYFMNIKNYVYTDDIFYFYRRHLNSITLSSYLKPNTKIFDIYPVLDILKESSIKNGTYQKYHDVLEEIIMFKAIDPLLTSSAWVFMNQHDHLEILTNIRSYIKKQYGVRDILAIPLVQEKMKNSFKYKMLLELYFYQAPHSFTPRVEYGDSLDATKRILEKYKKWL